jgi:hypothetical protein
MMNEHFVGYYNDNDDVLYNMCNNKVHDAMLYMT